MTHRERALAALNEQSYDRLPLVHFGFWAELLKKWRDEGHLTEAEGANAGDVRPEQSAVTRKLGFDFNWHWLMMPATSLRPGFEIETIKAFPDGTVHRRNQDGVTVMQSPGNISIPGEIDHLLTGRASWEEHYKSRLRWDPARVEHANVFTGADPLRFDRGGMEFLREGRGDFLRGIHLGSMIGRLRDITGIVGLSYLLVDDEPLVDEMLEAMQDLSYRCAEHALARGARFDFAHFWEDICYKSGPLVSPAVFAAKAGPGYRRITELFARHGVDLVSVDCDGKIDALIPTWLENGVNIMFPIEVGTWEASFLPWRERYGNAIKGVGAVDKRVFAKDRAAIDAEIERLRPMVEAGGFIPCPDHRLPLEAEWDLVRYYTDRMRGIFS